MTDSTAATDAAAPDAAELPTNWGRWGDDDQLGPLNLIDAAARTRAAGEVRSGHHVSLARTVQPVPFSAGLGPVGRPATMPAAVLQTVNFGGTRPLAVTDTLIVNTHNAGLTHLDSLAHMPVDNQVYPGVPLDDAVSAAGVRHGSGNSFGAGLVTRGVLLDLAPQTSLDADRRIGASDLQAALEQANVRLHPGDAVAVRGGWDTNIPLSESVPGLDLSAVDWLNTSGVSVYIGDIGDPRPPTLPLPLHQVALARLGLPLVDAAALEELAEVCRSEQRSSFMLVLAPPPITGTTGLPVNPIAIFWAGPHPSRLTERIAPCCQRLAPDSHTRSGRLLSSRLVAQRAAIEGGRVERQQCAAQIADELFLLGPVEGGGDAGVGARDGITGLLSRGQPALGEEVPEDTAVHRVRTTCHPVSLDQWA